MFDKTFYVFIWFLLQHFGDPLSAYRDKCLWNNATLYYPGGSYQNICSRNPREITIPIGLIFNSDDIQMRSAFRFTIEQYHMNHEMPNRRFSINPAMSITDVANSFRLASSLCSQMSTGVFLFFGTRTVQSLDLLEDYTKRFQMPYISPSLSKVATSTVGSESFQISMRPPITDAIIDMITFFKWDFVHYLYDSNEGLMRLQDLFSNRSNHKELEVKFTYRKLEDVHHAHEDLRTVDRMNMADQKNIILDLSSFEAFQSVLRQIAEVGMNKHEYFYLLTTLDFSRLDFRRFIHGGVNLTGFDIIDPYNEQYGKFMLNWKTAESNHFSSAGTDLMSDSALAVDGARVIIETFNDMLIKNSSVFKMNFRGGLLYNNYTKPGIPCTRSHDAEPHPPPWMQGPAIFDAIKNVEFQGVTGKVKFNNMTGFRENFTLQVSGVGLHQTPFKLGTWSKHDKFVPLDGEEYRPPYFENVTDRDVKIITTILSKPMLMKKSQEDIIEKNLTGNAVYEGFVPDLAKLLSERIGFRYKLVEVPDNNYGREIAPGVWNGMVQELKEKRADMAIADFTITFDRETIIDFTKPFMEIGISIMIKMPDVEKPGVFSFLKPFNFKIWIFILLAYASVSIGLFLVSRFSPYEWTDLKGQKDPQLNEEFSLFNSFWFSTGALMLQGSDSCPRSISGRVIGTVWWFFVLIIISSYTANLAAFLTIERMVSPIESADDLSRQTEIKYGCINSGTTREFFANSKVPVYQDMWRFMMSNPHNMVNTSSEGIDRVRNSKGKYAFLVESNVIEYENSVQPCDTFKVGRNLNNKGFGVATPKKSELRDVLNLHVLELTEDSTLIKLKNKWWSDRSQCSNAGGKDSSRKSSLSLSNVAGVFYILISGLVIAVIYGTLSFIALKVRLMPVASYAKGLPLSPTSFEVEKGNGSLSEYAINNGHSHQDGDGVKTYTYNAPPMIGFEAFQQPQEHSDV